jgi:ubiquinone biosynthesis protein Coq4
MAHRTHDIYHTVQTLGREINEELYTFLHAYKP